MIGEMNIEVDENDNQIGLRPKKDFENGKYIHRASHLILFNSENKILLQKRAITKKLYPNLYTFSVAGKVKNQTYEECVQEEMNEEIGINIPVKELFKFYIANEYDKAFHTIFLGNSDEKIIPDPREIQSIKWLSPEELEEDIEKNPEKYTPPLVKGMKMFLSKHYNK